jgi:hypothetical protein
MKVILLSFAFINFSESSLFKGLRAKKIKNFPIPKLASWVAVQTCQTAHRLHSGAQPPPSPVNESSSNTCSTGFWFWQANATLKDGRKAAGASAAR